MKIKGKNIVSTKVPDTYIENKLKENLTTYHEYF